MTRIYINGASGKMGQSLSKLIESDDQFQSVSENDFSLSDVVVDFSNPISTLKILKRCLEINVPIMVTDNTPIIIPNAVSIDLVLLAKIAESDIKKFSIKSKNITTQNLQLFSHQII